MTGEVDAAPARGRPLFFSHIPKSGGMLLRYFLQDQFPAAAVCPLSDWAGLLRASPEALRAYGLVQGHFVCAAQALLPPVDVITFVREPIARTLSLMLHLKRDPAFHALHERARDRSIPEMLDDPHLVQHLSNQQTTYLGSPVDFVQARQALQNDRPGFDIGDFMSAPDLEVAKQVLRSLAFVGLTERMEESMARLCGRFSFHPASEYRKRNAASHAERSLLDDLPASVLAQLRVMNEADIALYDLAREIFEAQGPAPGYDELVRGSLGRHPAFAGTVPSRLDVGGPLTGTNWYEPESQGGQAPYRWSGPSGTSSFEWPRSIEKFDLARVRVFPLPGQEIAGSLSLRMDGRPVAPGRPDGEGGWVFEVPIVGGLAGERRGFHQLVLTHAAEPAEQGNGDHRVLHFGLTSVDFLPLSASVLGPDAAQSPAAPEGLRRQAVDLVRAHRVELAAALQALAQAEAREAGLREVLDGMEDERRSQRENAERAERAERQRRTSMEELVTLQGRLSQVNQQARSDRLALDGVRRELAEAMRGFEVRLQDAAQTLAQARLRQARSDADREVGEAEWRQQAAQWHDRLQAQAEQARQDAARQAGELAALQAGHREAAQALERAQRQLAEREAAWAERHGQQERQWQARWDELQARACAWQVEAAAAQARLDSLARERDQALQALEDERHDAARRQQAEAASGRMEADRLRALQAVESALLRHAADARPGHRPSPPAELRLPQPALPGDGPASPTQPSWRTAEPSGHKVPSE